MANEKKSGRFEGWAGDMNELRVKLLPATEKGRLYYSRDEEIEPLVLFIKSPAKRKVAYHINICAGGALLSLDEDRILQSAEFIIPRKAWEKGVLDVPRPHVSADVQFPDIRFVHNELELPVKAMTDEKYAHVEIWFSESQAEMTGEWVALSAQCHVLVAQDSLRGFHVALSS